MSRRLEASRLIGIPFSVLYFLSTSSSWRLLIVQSSVWSTDSAHFVFYIVQDNSCCLPKQENEKELDRISFVKTIPWLVCTSVPPGPQGSLASLSPLNNKIKRELNLLSLYGYTNKRENFESKTYWFLRLEWDHWMRACGSCLYMYIEITQWWRIPQCHLAQQQARRLQKTQRSERSSSNLHARRPFLQLCPNNSGLFTTTKHIQLPTGENRARIFF